MDRNLGNSFTIARCTWKDSTYAFYIPNGSNYDYICQEIQARFPDVISKGLKLKYFFQGGTRCNLESDNDVQMMLMSQYVAKADFIELELFDTSSCGSPVLQKETMDVMDLDDPISNFNPALAGDAAVDEIVSITDSWRNHIQHVKQVFYGGRQEFKRKLIKFAIDVGFKLRFVKNDKARVTAICAKKRTDGCQWRIHASVNKVNGHFYIRTFNNLHTCGGNVTSDRSAMVNSHLVASIIMQMIRQKPQFKPSDIMRDMKARYGLDVSYWNAWYGRELARKELHGDQDDSYQQLVVYLNMVLDTNPGSHCRIEFDEVSQCFTRCFVAFGGCIKGFQKCRPILCVDGTHLKSKHKGTLLVATGKNGNQGLYPIVFAVVDNESDESWGWFMEHLRFILEPYPRKITFLSDRNIGLLNAVREWFPDSPHGYCYHHLRTNIQAKFPGSVNKDTRDKVLELFTRCAYTFSKKVFHKALEELKTEGGPTMQGFLSTLPFGHWANSYFPGDRYGEMSSNIVESFNSMVLEERTLPITQLVDGIRSRLMKFIGDRSKDAKGWTSMLVPKMEKLMNKHVRDGQHWIVNRSNEDVYEVYSDYKCKVDIGSRSCSCSRWKLLGFPCVHAVTVMKFIGLDPYQFVEGCFTAENFRECYSYPIYPIVADAEDMHDDDEVPLLLPPTTKTQPGRPRSNRIKSTGEVGKIKCGRCGQLGSHNRRTCQSVL